MVSNQGNVMSVPRVVEANGVAILHPGRLKSAFDNGRGYQALLLNKDGSYKQTYVHRLVAEAFIPNPRGKKEVNHKDGNKKNNCAENLEWVTSSENKIHAHRVIKTTRPNRHLTEEQVVSIRSDRRLQREIAEDYGVDPSIIGQIKRGDTYKSFPGELECRGSKATRKLTCDQAREILASDETGRVLAERYGVSESTIFAIRKGIRYKEVQRD